MPLTDVKVRNAKPIAKPYKFADERGLYLLINQVGKYWRFDYRFTGKRKTLALGTYPDVSLSSARSKLDDARKLLANDVDPSEYRKVQKATNIERAANSFEAVAREWIAKFAPNWSPAHGKKITKRFERDVFPWVGGRPVIEVTAPLLLTVVRRIEGRGATETAHRALQSCGQVMPLCRCHRAC